MRLFIRFFLGSFLFLASLLSSPVDVNFHKKLQYNLVAGLQDIYLDPRSERIGCTWSQGQVYDKPLIAKFYSLLKEHNQFFVAIDLGAQTGCFSLLAKFFPNSQWYSFEPIPEVADTLKTNLSLNGIQNVSVYQMAASDSSGEAILKLPPMNAWGLATLGQNVLRFTPVGEIKIPCIDLDRFVAEHHIAKVDFIKMDTEGWELYILKGAVNLIRRDHPVILMEYNTTNGEQCGVRLEQINEFLRAMNYQWQSISGDDILCTYH